MRQAKAKRYTNTAVEGMPVANTGRLKSGISPKAVADVMAPTKPCSLFIGYSFLVDE